MSNRGGNKVMDKIDYVRKLKSIIEEKGTCYIKTTEKKGEGFVPYNIHDIKWGQVDVEPSKIRVVIDLYPYKYSVEDLKDFLGIALKEMRKRITGFYFEKTEETEPPFHDVLTISLYNDFFQSNKYIQTKLLEFIDRAAIEATFKTDYPHKFRKR